MLSIWPRSKLCRLVKKSNKWDNLVKGKNKVKMALIFFPSSIFNEFWKVSEFLTFLLTFSSSEENTFCINELTFHQTTQLYTGLNSKHLHAKQ